MCLKYLGCKERYSLLCLLVYLAVYFDKVTKATATYLHLYLTKSLHKACIVHAQSVHTRISWSQRSLSEEYVSI